MDMETLYVSDLDGTLLGENAVLSNRSKEILTQLLNDGLIFTVATARSIVSVQAILKGLPLRLPVIEFNGAFLSDYTSGQHLVINSVSREISDALHACVLEMGHAPFVSTFDGKADRLYFDKILNSGMEWYLEDRKKNHDPRLTKAVNTADALTEQVVCMTVIGRQGPLEELEGTLGRRFGSEIEIHCVPHIYSEGWHWLTVHDRKATKDQGIQSLREYCGLKNSELVVFGDHANDVKMFRAADRGIAVENATEDLKRIGQRIIGPNTDDSVALFLLNEVVRK